MSTNFRPIEELQVWVREVRGRNLLLADALGVKPPTVSDWVTGKKSIPLDKVRPIETFTQGAVHRRHMRRDDYLIHWPELALAHTPPAPSATETVAEAQAAIQQVTSEAVQAIRLEAVEAVAVIEHAAEELRTKNAPWDGNERRGAARPEAGSAGQGV